MRKPANPFIITGYHSPEYFCDRVTELAWLSEQVNNERNSVLYSWRRMGKTALIRHFFHDLEQKKAGEGVFVDLLGTANLLEANRRIASAIVQKFGELRGGLGSRVIKLLSSIGATVAFDPQNGVPQVTFGVAAPPSVSASLEAVGTFLMERKSTVVICLDEFQQIVNYEENNAEATFRSWMQSFPMVRFIFSGSHRSMMASMFSEESRPFYRSAQLQQLDPLKADDYAAFILSLFQKSGKRIERLHIDRIFQWTRLQTYYVQLACNKLYGKTDTVDDTVIEEVWREIVQQEIPIFSMYQQLLTSFQWKLLVAIAKAESVENPLSQSFLRTYALGAASSVSAALATLVKKEFVVHHEGKYTLHDTLLMRWLQEL